MTRTSLASIPTEAVPPTDNAAWDRLTAALEALAKPAAPPVDPELQCYTPAQAAALLGVKENWVVERITRREIPFCFVGRFPRLRARHIRAIADADEVDPAAIGRKAA